MLVHVQSIFYAIVLVLSSRPHQALAFPSKELPKIFPVMLFSNVDYSEVFLLAARYDSESGSFRLDHRDSGIFYGSFTMEGGTLTRLPLEYVGRSKSNQSQETVELVPSLLDDGFIYTLDLTLENFQNLSAKNPPTGRIVARDMHSILDVNFESNALDFHVLNYLVRERKVLLDTANAARRLFRLFYDDGERVFYLIESLSGLFQPEAFFDVLEFRDGKWNEIPVAKTERLDQQSPRIDQIVLNLINNQRIIARGSHQSKTLSWFSDGASRITYLSEIDLSHGVPKELQYDESRLETNPTDLCLKLFHKK